MEPYAEKHLRHPDGKQLERAWVDGEVWNEFDPAKSAVRLPADRKSMKVTLFYA